jgi:HEAT repeat protein
MLESSDPGIRATAAELLGAVKDPSAAPALKKHLQDKSRNVVMEAARALARHNDRSGVPVLIRMLSERPEYDESNTAARMKAARANIERAKAAAYLGSAGDKSATDALNAASQEDEGRVKDAALIALIKLGDKSKVDVFVEGLDSGFESAIEKSLEVLGELKDSSAKERMRELLKTWNKNIRSAAAAALGRIGDTESAGRLREMLTDKYPSVRTAAAGALGELRDLGSLDALKKTLSDENGYVRLEAAEALMKLGDDSGGRFVVSSVSALDIDARIKAVRILADYGKKAAADVIENAYANETNASVRLEMSTAIMRIIDREG